MDKKYGPEDIEKLLLTKEFTELYPEEEAYILEHIQDKDEYARMRALLDSYQKSDEAPQADLLRPMLMDRFERKHQKRGFIVWLNTLFASLSLNNQAWTPVLRLAGIFLAIGLVWVFFFRDPLVQSDSMALEPESVESEVQSPTSSHTQDNIVVPQNESSSSVTDDEVSAPESTLQPEKDIMLENNLPLEVSIGREVEAKTKEAFDEEHHEIEAAELAETEGQVRDDVSPSDEVAEYTMNQTAATSVDVTRIESDFGSEDIVALDLNTQNQRPLLTDDMLSFLYTAP